MQNLLLIIFLMLRPVSSLPSNSGQVLVTIEQAQQALNYALSQVNVPYVWGGQSPAGFDCSGLQKWSYRQVIPNIIFASPEGPVLDVTEDNLYKYNILMVSSDEVAPGDLVFITNDPNKITHGGMFIRWIIPDEEFEFINASSYWGKVVIDTWPVQGEVRGQWFAGFGRLKYYQKPQNRWQPKLNMPKPNITKPAIPILIPFS